jgi:hypothetical protein
MNNVNLVNQEENERIHKLVVKIISWKSGLQQGAAIIPSNKITPKEWANYKKHIQKISKTLSSEEVNKKLKEAEAAIKKNGGFE